jgi:hypothetical protein
VISEVIFLVEDASEGGYTAKALDYSIYTQANTWDELKEAIMDSINCHFDSPSSPPLTSTTTPSNISWSRVFTLSSDFAVIIKI